MALIIYLYGPVNGAFGCTSLGLPSPPSISGAEADNNAKFSRCVSYGENAMAHSVVRLKPVEKAPSRFNTTTGSGTITA